MWKRVTQSDKTPWLLAALIFCCIFSGCAAVGKIEPNTWLGMVDLAVAGGIAMFIFKGSRV